MGTKVRKYVIPEEMRFLQTVVKYIIKHKNNAKTTRRYHTNCQQVQRSRKKHNGDIKPLAHISRRPMYHPNQHTDASGLIHLGKVE